MKKVLLLVSILGLAACQAPYERNIYQATGPRVCYEYYDSFRCGAPQKIYHETVYPKNDVQMQYGDPVYLQYQPQSLSKAVYGTY